MIKLVVINKNVMLHAIDNSESVYLSMIAVVNLLNNVGKTIVVRESIEEGNEQKFKVRAEMLGKYSEDGAFKVAIGKSYTSIKSKKDIDHEHIFTDCGSLKTFAEVFEEDYKNQEEYQALLSIHKLNNKSNSKQAAIEI